MSECEVCGGPLLTGAFFCGECGSSTRPRLDPRGVSRTDTRSLPLTSSPTVFPNNAAGPTFSDVPDSAIPPVDVVADFAAALSFTLLFSNGDSITVSSGGLLGRNPVAATGDTGDHLIIVTDPDRTVSKTHLEFGIEAGSFWVCDRFSGNGTTVHEVGRPARRLVPGRRYRVERGTLVGIGEQSFTVT